MKFNFRKKCPRCQTKMAMELTSCPSCGLNYKKFYEATNAEAKQAIKEGRKDEVLMRVGYPVDVKKWVLILLTIFGGWFGLHYYYVGRNKMGLFFTSAFLVGAANAALTIFGKTHFSGFVGELFYCLVLVWGAVIFMWIVDMAKVCFNKFKIPVSRDRG